MIFRGSYFFNKGFIGTLITLLTAAVLGGCAAPQTTVTVVGATAGMGPRGYDENGRFKSASLRKELLYAIDSGQFGVNAWVAADTNSPSIVLTPLCAATRQGNIETIQALLARGAKVNLECSPAGTRYPLDVMIEKERKYTFYFDETVGALASAGAKVKKPQNQARLDAYYAELRAEGVKRAEDRKRSYENAQGILAVAGAAVIGKSMSGPSYTDAQRSAVVDAYVQDRMNAANGSSTNQFESAANSVIQQIQATETSSTQSTSSQAPRRDGTLVSVSVRSASGESVSASVGLSPSGGSSNASGAQAGGYGEGSSDSPRPKKLYPLVRHFTYPTLGTSEQEACADATNKVERDIANGSLGKIISRASCSCTREALTVGGTMIQCKIPITSQLMVDYDPNASTSNSSK